jgi:adenine-specific DNA glycosylase
MSEDGKPEAILGKERREQIREALLSWFEENGRDLPWRRTRDLGGCSSPR